MKPPRNYLLQVLIVTQRSSILGPKWVAYVLSIQPRGKGRVEVRKKGSRGEGRGRQEGGEN